MDMTALPADWREGHFALRVESPGGPMVVALQYGAGFDMTPVFGTASAWLNDPNPLKAISLGSPVALGTLGDLLAPNDLQAAKACGVTYVRSMLERVIEERCRGDAAQAEAVRAEMRAVIGEDLTALVPGSPAAMQVKERLLALGWWSQYLEVGIGPDVEIFSKAQPMASVGHGAAIGIHPMSGWNNPEPEAVLAVSAAGKILGAALGNDVNLRDVEGRSALLLGRAKDNNAASAIGPAIRLFDAGFSLPDVIAGTTHLTITGEDGFRLEETGAVAAIARDPVDIVAQLMGTHHQYPDGAMLYLGTPFSPSKDRGAPGMGFTHKVGDVVTISSKRLGTLSNTVRLTSECPPWTFGVTALFGSLARRGYPRR